jgi:antitoxin component YwqK of YwqJK toxin-antitoxin module
MAINKTIVFLGITTIIFAGCHNNPEPQKTVPVAQQAPVVNYPSGPDTSFTKAVANPNAKEGMNIIRYKDGVMRAKGNYMNGLKDGEWQSFYEDGKLWSDEYFSKGIPDGKITVWYDSEQKFYEGEYKDGRPVNTWSYWGKDGKLIRTSDYNKKNPNTAL